MMRCDDSGKSADLIRAHLRKYNRAFFTDSEDVNIIDEEDGVFRGGLAACRDFDTLYIEYLVVDPAFRGRGIGTGLGLSKWGARGMAVAAGDRDGYYRTILSHYYPGTALVTVYAAGEP